LAESEHETIKKGGIHGFDLGTPGNGSGTLSQSVLGMDRNFQSGIASQMDRDLEVGRLFINVSCLPSAWHNPGLQIHCWLVYLGGSIDQHA
jgi:hypothetical protein